MRALTLLVALVSALGVSGCIRHGGNGESCQAPGLEDPEAVGQCASGFVCTPDTSGQTGNGQSAHWDTSTCRPTCSSSRDCAVGTICRTVAGADYLMACQPN